MPENGVLSVVVITPSTGLCRLGYAQSLARLVAYYSQVRVFEDQPRQNLRTDGVEGSGIGQNYDMMIEKYLADEEIHWTHFLSVEDDMMFGPDVLHLLLRRKLDIVGANYSVNKGSPLWFTARRNGQTVLTTDDSEGVEEVDLLSQGVTLVARQVYEKIPKPRYLNGYCPRTGGYVSQDFYFSQQAREAGFKLYVDHDVSKSVAHIGVKQYSYQDALADELERRQSRDRPPDSNTFASNPIKEFEHV